MSRSINSTYNIRSINSHLNNILDSEYYTEIGTVHINVIDELLAGKEKKITDIIDEDIMNNGIGKIIGDKDELEYQLNYLYLTHARISSNKIVLTCGTIKYYDQLGTEKFAPIFLIPIAYDPRTNIIYLNGVPEVNPVFIRYAENNRIYTEKIINYLLSLRERKISTIDDIDSIMLELLDTYNLNISTSSYLTKMIIEYSDLIIPSDYFDHQASINEINDIELLKQFFNNCKTVLPTNMEQKHIILNSHLGKNFAVDGKIGSGKTSTIINIIADAIERNKRVLYINRDMLNMADVRTFFYQYGLGSYICELNNSNLIINNNDRILLNKKDEFNPQCIEKLAKDEANYDFKYHGYPYTYIVEKLACMKEKGDDELIEMSDNLDREEIEFIYKSLKIIEEEFKYVDPFKSNLWSTLLSSKNAPKVDEIIKRTDDFYQKNQELISILDDFCDKFGLNTIVNIVDFNHLTEQLLSFENVRPYACWIEDDFKEKSSNALKVLAREIDLNYNSLEWYHANLIDNYEPSSAEKVLKVITHGHYKIDDNESPDIKYVDLLLAAGKNFVNLVDRIEDFIRSSSEEYKQFDKYFNFTEPNKEQFIFMEKLLNLLEKYSVNEKWLNLYATSPTTMVNKHKELLMKLNEADELVLSIKNYFDIESYDIDELNNSINSHKFASRIKPKIDRKALRKNHKDLKELINLIIRYNKLSKEIKALMPEELKLHHLNEPVLKNFLGFLDFISNISSYETLAFTNFILNYKEDNRIKKLMNSLSHIRTLTKDEEKIRVQLGIYNITYTGEHLMERVKNLKSQVPYLERVIASCDKLNSYYSHKDLINCFDIKVLIEVDKAYLENLKEFNENKDNYLKLFGDNFKEFETNTVTLGQTIDHFLLFLKRLNGKVDILKLIDLKTDTFKELISHNQQFIRFYDEWYNALRAFSTCFYSGKMSIQSHSFKEVDSKLYEYVIKSNQVEHVSNIEHILDSFYTYKLNKLAENIQSGEYSENIAEHYLYSTLYAFYNKLTADNFEGIKAEMFMKDVEEFIQNEENYCVNNLITLKDRLKYTETSKEVKKKYLNFNVLDYEEIMKKAPNYQKLFIMDADTLNNINDLSYFDLVVLDDAHLDTANKYTGLFNNQSPIKQLIIFGDKMFQTSVTNTFMQRIDKEYMLKLRKRYLNLNLEGMNIWDKDNQFILDPNSKIQVEKYQSIDEMYNSAVLNFEASNHTINILVLNEIMKKECYIKIVNTLRLSYNLDQTITFLNTKINILTMGEEASCRCDDIYLWYPDFMNLSKELKQLFVRNYIVAEGNIHIGIKNSKSVKNNELINQDISEYINAYLPLNPYIEGSIITYMIKSLLVAGVTPLPGPGLIDIVLQNENEKIGIIVLGKRKDKRYSMIDDLIFYTKAYIDRGWKIYTYSTERLYNDYNNVIIEIVNNYRRVDI